MSSPIHPHTIARSECTDFILGYANVGQRVMGFSQVVTLLAPTEGIPEDGYQQQVLTCMGMLTLPVPERPEDIRPVTFGYTKSWAQNPSNEGRFLTQDPFAFLIFHPVDPQDAMMLMAFAEYAADKLGIPASLEEDAGILLNEKAFRGTAATYGFPELREKDHIDLVISPLPHATNNLNSTEKGLKAVLKVCHEMCLIPDEIYKTLCCFGKCVTTPDDIHSGQICTQQPVPSAFNVLNTKPCENRPLFSPAYTKLGFGTGA